MADTYAKILVHCIFSTKGRRPSIPEPAKLWPYLRGVGRNRGVDTLAVGGTDNHVHILLSIPTSLNVAQVMRDLKANSSRHLREQGSPFAWQDGYCAVSVSPSQVGVVVKYIESQQQHHATRTFEDEYTSVLQKSGVPYSSEYVFD